MKLATWNVNSLKVRLEQVLDWFEQQSVDVLALQETKMTDDQFPVESFVSAGYHVSFSGQKTYNGVAIISRTPLSHVEIAIPGYDDPQRRVIAATVAGIRLINLYVPNGAAVGTDKYDYKLMWLSQVQEYVADQLNLYPQLAVVGDFNIAPEDLDVHDPIAWQGAVLVSPAERSEFQSLLNLGLVDSFRSLYPAVQAYSWWDYRAASFRRNLGMRIDHILLSQPLMAVCTDTLIDKQPRQHERPSDHAPVVVNIDTPHVITT